MTGRPRVAAAALALALVALSGCAAGQAHTGTAANPLAGATFYADPAGAAARTVG
jgi:hypothetical protein